MGTGKIIIAVTAIALSIVGVKFAHDASHGPMSPAEILAATPADKIAQSIDYPLGDTVVLMMEHDKIYRINYPQDKMPEVLNTTTTFGSDGVLRSATTTKNQGLEEGIMEVGRGPERIELNITPLATLAACNIFERTDKGLLLTTWSDLRPETAPELSRLTSGYMEGRISVKQYREGVANEFKRRGIGPKTNVHKKMYYDEITNNLPAPMTIPPDLAPLMKGAN